MSASRLKAVLFDVDGVLALPEKPFGVQNALNKQIDLQIVANFFKNDFQRALTGESDLKQLIETNPGVWNWHGSPEELLQAWFEAENCQNAELVDIITQLRANELKCFVVTDQEKYRASYIRTIMFPGMFDGFFISSELGYQKVHRQFFSSVAKKLAALGIQPYEALYFDDSADNVQSAQLHGINGKLFQNNNGVASALKAQGFAV